MFCLWGLYLSNGVIAQSAHTLLRQGDVNYEENRYQQAELAYRKSLDKEITPRGSYNLGNTIYQQQRFEEAVGHYEAAIRQAKNNTIKAKAYHNLGNTYFEQQNFQESVEAYKNALRLNPEDVDTKFNLGQAQRQLRLQQEQQQQQQQDSESQDQEEEEQQQQQQQEQQQEQEQEQDNQNEQQQEQSINNEEQEQEQSQPQPKDLSKQEAQQLLDIMDEEERKVQEKLKKAQSKPSKSKKDY